DWLLSKRKADGSWEPEAHAMHEDVLKADADQQRLASTAYVAWAVFADGQAADSAKETRAYLLSFAPGDIKNAHVLALVCNALLTLDPKGEEVGRYLDRLADMKTADKGGKGVYWELPAGARTTFYGGGLGGQIETTALAALALIDGKRHPEVARGALGWLVSKKGPSGPWHSAPATALRLQAPLAGTRPGPRGAGPRRTQAEAARPGPSR